MTSVVAETGTGLTLAGLDLPPPEVARQYRELVRNKGYRAFPLGQEAGQYLRSRRKRLQPRSYDEYESALDKLARYFTGLELRDFEPPVGTERIEEFLDAHWGERAGRTYNKNLTAIREFFKWAILRGKLHGDPTLAIERARKQGVHREIFSADQRRAIVAAQPELRDRIALRLLFDYALRKGALQGVRFQHFDHQRKRLTFFTKGAVVRELVLPDPAFWDDLGRLIIDAEAKSGHYLLPRQKAIPRAGNTVLHRFPDQPMGGHGLHSWWYRCLARAGVVDEGVERGEKMHKARHTAGQRVLDKTGNLKATQKLLGHSDLATTGNIYVDWDVDQLAETMRLVLSDDVPQGDE